MLNIASIESLGDVINGAVVALSCDSVRILHSKLNGASTYVETNRMIGRLGLKLCRRELACIC